MIPRFKPTPALLACLFLGFLAGGYRHPLAWTAAGTAIWTIAYFFPFSVTAPRLRPWMLWLGWIFFSLLVCEQPLKGLYAFSRWLTLFAYFGLAVTYWREKDSSRWFAALGLTTLVLGLGALFLPPALYPGTNRPVHPMTGFMPPYYNYTAFVEAAFWGAALGALGHPQRPKGKWPWAAGPKGWAAGPKGWAAGALMIFALALILKAQSRGGLLAVAAATGVWLVMRGKARWLAWALAGLTAMAALAPRESINRILKLDAAEGFKRPQIWRSALRMIGDHPFTGVGIDNFEQGFLRHNFPTEMAIRYSFSAGKAESEVFGLAAETGLVGLALFLLAVYHSLRPISWNGAVQQSGLCAFAAMTTHALVDNMLHMPALAMLYVSSIACAAGGEKTDSAQNPPRASRSLWKGACLAGLILSWVSPLPQWLMQRYLDRYDQASDPGEKIAQARKAVALFPADYHLREKLAEAWLQTSPRRPEKALEELRRACALNPTRALCLMMQAQILSALGRDQEALPLLNRGIGLEPNFLGARILRARTMLKRGKKEAARLELQEVERRHKHLQTFVKTLNPDFYTGYHRALTSLDSKNFAAARRAAGEVGRRIP